MEFSRQEYWSGLPFPFPGDLLDPWIKHESPALQADSLLSEPPMKATGIHGPPKTVYKHLCVKCILLLLKGTNLQNIKNHFLLGPGETVGTDGDGPPTECDHMAPLLPPASHHTSSWVSDPCHVPSRLCKSSRRTTVNL